MKKFLAVLAIAGVVTACNNASEGTTSADTTTITADTTTTIAPAATDSVSGNSDSVGAATSTSIDTSTAQ